METYPDFARYADFARIARMSYNGPINQGQLRCDGAPLTHQKIVYGSFWRGYSRVFWNDAAVVVAFRGTRQFVDWPVSNLPFVPVALRDCGRLDPTVHVHSGFQWALDFRSRDGRRSFETLLDGVREHGSKKIYVTGHSLGGAIGMIFAAKMCACDPTLGERLQEVVTFGAPAAGLARLHALFADRRVKVIRFVNDCDAVPFTPPLFFRHIGDEVWLHGDGVEFDVGWRRRLKAGWRGVRALAADHNVALYEAKLRALARAAAIGGPNSGTAAAARTFP